MKRGIYSLLAWMCLYRMTLYFDYLISAIEGLDSDQKKRRKYWIKAIPEIQRYLQQSQDLSDGFCTKPETQDKAESKVSEVLTIGTNVMDSKAVC